MSDDTQDERRRGPWTIRAERVGYRNPWLTVTEYDVLKPDGAPGLYGVVSPVHLAIGVVPVFADGTVMLVGQHRFALDAHSWELPEGGGKPDVPPLESAKRELLEETGLTAANWREILDFDVSNSVTDERAIAFLAWDLARGEAAPEGAEADITQRREPFQAALEMAMSGEIRDGFTLAMLAKADYMARKGMLPDALAAAILAEPPSAR
ncbi:DNA mismatch repair protein MutT [Marinicauda salina]|uniref:GDP-mannose pyrophosphatase n=1 Tax=Marinicauda salina TaxID=2135793 RepID=A0A2U2BU19_9PROT|nr:NUDIX hydrolase [Marinicauda salina]PWE17480.1 DNA mismatch repair protein MutT [Marinicauda salina]